MKSVKEITENIEANMTLAETQDEYNALPVYNEKGVMAFAFELDEQEVEEIMEFKKIYISLTTFNQPLQPIHVNTHPVEFEEARKSIVEDFGLEDNFITRIQKELSVLSNKSDKLYLFVSSEKFKDIDKDQQFLLMQQYQIMQLYINVLTKRLELVYKTKQK